LKGTKKEDVLGQRYWKTGAGDEDKGKCSTRIEGFIVWS
jgi:hypothetical protein